MMYLFHRFLFEEEDWFFVLFSLILCFSFYLPEFEHLECKNLVWKFGPNSCSIRRVVLCVCVLVRGMSGDNTGVTGFLSKSNSITFLLHLHFIVTLSESVLIHQPHLLLLLLLVWKVVRFLDQEMAARSLGKGWACGNLQVLVFQRYWYFPI